MSASGCRSRCFSRKAARRSSWNTPSTTAAFSPSCPTRASATNPQISIIHVEGELYFGAADLFQEQVRRQAEDQNIRVFILRMKNARHLDASTVLALENLHDYLRQTDRHLLISGMSESVGRVLRNSGLYEKIGAENIFQVESNPTISTKRALERATQLLHTRKAEVRIFYDRPQAGSPEV